MWNRFAIENLKRIRLQVFIIPCFLLLAALMIVGYFTGFSRMSYVGFQKDFFLEINHRFAPTSKIEYNLTQLGDAFVFLSLISIIIVYIPTLWSVLLTSTLISALVSILLKNIFKVPRPATVMDSHTFNIVGKVLQGNSSLPSGHAITVCTTICVLMWGLRPGKKSIRFIWFFLWITLALIVMFSRVIIGAHYPLDVIFGGLIGYICGLVGIFIDRKYSFCNWFNHIKARLYVFILLIFCTVGLVYKVYLENLWIYYIALAGIMISTYQFYVKNYAKKET